MKIEIKKLPRSEVEIIGNIPTEDFEKFRAGAMRHVAEHTKLPGFRPGHVPENVLATTLGEMPILEEMAERALDELYRTILLENKIDAIGRPNITVTKLAKNNPFEFKIQIAVLPEIMLPDYKKIAGGRPKNQKSTVTEDEVEKIIVDIRKSRVATDHSEELPPMDEAFLQSLGGFKSLDELKKKIKENLQKEKEQKEREKRRVEILKNIAEKTEMELPDILVQSELGRMLSQFKYDISQMGIKFDDYLKHVEKKEEDLRKEWEMDARNKAKNQLILSRIAKEEKIAPDGLAMEEQVKHLMEYYADADEETTRGYVKMAMTNEKIFEFLEGISKTE